MNMAIDPSLSLQVRRWNDQYFAGQLSQAALSLMHSPDTVNDEASALVERALRWCKRARIEARDLTLFQAWSFGRLFPKLVPSAWGGLIPPVTREGRHRKIDEYVSRTPWRAENTAGTFLDIGCGLPPTTTVDTARRFPDWQVIGVDPQFHPYLLTDASGDYACLDGEGNAVYFQPSIPDIASWDALFADKPAAKARFENIAASLRGPLDGFAGTGPAAVEFKGMRLEKDPMRRFEKANMRLVRGGLGTVDACNVDVARCFNVLVYYDTAVRAHALDWLSGVLRPGGVFICGMDWVGTSVARYTVYRNEGAQLIEKEFAFSVDNVRPVGPVTCLAFCDGDYETERLAELVAALRSDESFRSRYDLTLDRILRDLEFCARDESGCLGGAPAALPAEEFERRFIAIEERLAAAALTEAAIDTLRRQGMDAWKNCVGHIAVAPAGRL